MSGHEHDHEKSIVEHIDDATTNPVLIGLSAGGLGCFILFSLAWSAGRTLFDLFFRRQ